jgi:adenosylcobinamide kinase/adenosylcobinamide-phosphate guanylyltransferase
LVIGGARSGKTAYAMKLAAESGFDRILIATAEAGDAEMQDRIARHRSERDDNWRVIEEPVDLIKGLEAAGLSGGILVVDCLTIWLSNLYFREIDHVARIEELAEWLGEPKIPTIFVSNELGLGLVPDSRLGRSFRDAHGLMNQKIAAICDSVTLVAAGLPLFLKTDQEASSAQAE